MLFRSREKEYWNLIAARTADLSDPAKLETYAKIVKAYQSEAMKNHLAELYGGFFRPVGWDEDLLAPFKK